MKLTLRVLPQFVMGALMLILLSGCATIFSKSDYPVTIKSSPSALSIEVTNSAGELVYKGTTPSTIVLPAAKGILFAPETYTFKLFKDSKEVGSRTVSADIDPWFYGNLLGLPVFFVKSGPYDPIQPGPFRIIVLGCIAVDSFTGSMWRLPDEVMIQSTSSD